MSHPPHSPPPSRRPRSVVAATVLLAALVAAPAPAVAQNHLSPTIDADSTDPYVVAKAAELGNAVVPIFAFVRDAVRHEAYVGSLRGARGTLWSGAGNALDRASLLVALLRASGIPARYASGTLDDAHAARLVQSMFPQPARVLGCLDAGTAVADPGTDARLVAEARAHTWVEVDPGGGFQAADPSFPEAELGDAFAALDATFDEVPLELRHAVTLRLRREIFLPDVAQLSGNAEPSESTVLDVTYATAELVGRSVTVGQRVAASVLSPVIAVQTNVYSPYVLVNQRDGDVSDDGIVRGSDFQEVLTSFPFGNEILTGLFLDVIVQTPRGDGSTESETITKTLLDRIGVVGRGTGGAVSVALPTDGAPALTDGDLVTLDVATADQPVEPLLAQADVLDARMAEIAPLRAAFPDPDTAPLEVRQQLGGLLELYAYDVTSQVAGTFGFGSDRMRRELSAVALAHAYLDSPRIVAVSSRSDPAPPPARSRFSIDILRTRPRVEPYPGQAVSAGRTFRPLLGLIDSVVEAVTLGEDPALATEPGSSLGLVTRALASPGAALVGLRAGDDARLAQLPLPAEARQRIANALAAGRSVLVPDTTVAVAGEERSAWLEVDAAGNAIAVSDTGEHTTEENVLLQTGFQRLAYTFIRRQVALEAAEGGSGAAATAARNPQTYAQAVCTTGLYLVEGVSGVAGVDAGTNATWVQKACKRDPPIGSALLGSPEPSSAFPTLGDGATGVAVDAVVDSFFHVLRDGGPVPTVFRVAVENLGATSDTFVIAPSDLPAGFSACQSVPELTLAPGATGEITIGLLPAGGVPASGTPASFRVTASSVADPAITAHSDESFAVPDVHAITLDATPAALTTAPGVPVTTTLTVRAAGNVGESVGLALELPDALDASPLAALVLTAGASATRSLTLTPAAGVAPNTLLHARVVATFPGALAPVTLDVPVQVIVPGAAATGAAADAADATGDTGLAARLRDLSVALTTLVLDPADATARGALLAALDAVIGLLDDDPALEELAARLTTARDALAAAHDQAAVMAASGSLGEPLDELATLLVQRVAHGFTLALSPNTALARPQAATRVALVLRNTGSQSSTFTFAVGGLPAGVAATFDPPSITLAPGEVVPRVGAPGVALVLTPGGTADLTAASFAVRASVQQAPEVQRVAAGTLAVRDEIVSVAAVVATPAFTDAGGSVAITARLVNAVNRRRSVRVAWTARDAGGAVVRSAAAVEAELALGDTLQNVALAPLETSGLADGAYAIEVAVSEADGTPIPGATGSGRVLVGAPVTASMALDPPVLLAGDGEVTATLELATDVAFPPPFTLRGLVATPHVGEILNLNSVALDGSLAYVCSQEEISIVDVSDPDAPAIVASFADALIATASATACTIENDVLYAVTTDATTSRVLTFSLADPLAPQHLATIPVPYVILGDVSVRDGKVLLSTGGVFFFLGVQNFVFRQFGDLIAVDTTGASPGVTDVLFDTTGPNLGSLSNFGQIARVTDDIAYVTGSTSEGADTQLGQGRLLVVDVSDPAHLTVLDELVIPDTVQATGVAVQGTHALVAGSTGGWRTPFNPDFTDFGFLGTTTLTSLDVSDPAHPQLVGPTLVTDFAPVVVSGSLHAAGGALYALTGIAAGGQQSVAFVDASNPESLVIASAPVPSGGLHDPRGFARAGTRFYTLSTLGLAVLDLGEVVGRPVTARVRIPKGSGVTALDDAFSSRPSEVIPGPDADTLLWRRTLAAGQAAQRISFGALVTDLLPGEARDVTLGATVEDDASPTSGTIELPPLVVVGEQVLALDPATRTVAPGESAEFTVTTRNPGSEFVLWTLALQGLPPAWVDLFPSVSVAPDDSSPAQLRLTPPADTPPGAYGFTVVVQSDGGRVLGEVTGTLVVDGTPRAVDVPSRGVVVALDPASASAGQGTSAFFRVRVTNVGSTDDTYSIELPALASGLVAAQEDFALDVPAGATRDTTVALTPRPGTPTGAAPFTVRARANGTDDLADEASGTVMVLAQGVVVTLDPPSALPASGFTLTVRNTGAARETFDLAVLGALAPATTLAVPSVTLDPGASQQVSIGFGALDGALSGVTRLLASATARSNPAVTDVASAFVELPPRLGVAAAFAPPAVDLPAPDTTQLQLVVQNAGNVADTLRVRIVGTTGPLSAVLSGLDRQPTAAIPQLFVPGRATSVIPLTATLTAAGVATVTVRVESLSADGPAVEVVGTVRTAGAASPTPSPTATATPMSTPTPTPTPTPRTTSTPNVTPTATATPSATPSPTTSPGARDAVECYVVRTKTGTPQLPPLLDVSLADAFETIRADVVREKRVCLPAALDAQQPLDEATDLACYALRPAPGQDLVTPPDARIVNRFGAQTVRFLGSSNDRTLCVAADAVLPGGAAEAARDLQDLRCRRVRGVPSAALRPMPEVVVQDGIEQKRMRVRRIDRLCSPVVRDGAPDVPIALTTHLACYQLSQVAGQAAFVPPGDIGLDSAIGSQTVIVRNAQRTLCVPTAVE